MADAKLRAVISVADKSTTKLRGINKSFRNLTGPITRINNQLRALDRVSGFKALRNGLGGVRRQLGLLGAGLTGVAGGAFAAIKSLATTGDEVLKTATNFGITTDALQEWRFVAERSGVAQATLDKSFQAFTKRLSEARNGTGELFGLLKKVNPAFLEQILAIKNNEDAYAALIKGMSGLKSQQQQILLGDKAFSEAGRQLVKITAQGSKEIANLRKEAHKYGAVISGDVLRDSAKFKDEMTNIGSLFKAVGFTLGTALIPELSGLLIEFREWLLLSKQTGGQEKLKEFAKSMAQGVRDLATQFKIIVPKISSLLDSIGGFKTLAIGLAAILAGPLLAALVGLGGAIVTFGTFLVATPVGLFAAGVVAIGIAVYQLIGGFKSLINLYPKMVLAVSDTIETGINKFKEFLAFVKPVTDQVKGVFSKFIDNVMVLFEPLLNIGARIAKGFGALSGIGRLLGGAAPASGGASSSPAAQSTASKTRFLNEFKQQQNGAQKTDVGGRITVQIDSEGRIKKTDVNNNNPAVDLDIDAGYALAI